MPNAPKTPTRTFRCPDLLWRKAQERCREQGRTLTSVLIEALEDLLEEV